jgi:tripartite motif-containing protein 71
VFTRSRRLIALAVTVTAMAAVMASGNPVGAAVATPTYLRTIGFSGHAGVYAWGAATGIDGSIYVSDYNNYVIHRFTPTGTLIRTFSGRGSAQGQTAQPYNLAVDPNDGSVYMADLTPHEVEKYNAAGDPIWTVNVAPYGGFYTPRVAVNSQGWVYVVNSHSVENFTHRLIVLNPNGSLRFSVTYNSGASSAPGSFGVIRGIAIGPNDEIYLADPFNRRITVVDANGTYLRQFGIAGSGACRLGGDLRGLAVDADNGWLYVVDNAQGQVEKYTLAGTCVDTFTAPAPPAATAWGPRELTVGLDHNVYVADYTGTRVVVFNPNGDILRMFPDPPLPAPDGGLNQAEDVAVNNVTGDVYVADTWNHRIQRFTNGGAFVQAWGFRGDGVPNAMSYPRGIAIDQATGNVWLNNTRTGNIKVYTASGGFVRQFGSEGEGTNQFYYARGIWVAPNGTVYIPDSGNLRLKAVSQTGAVLWTRPCGAPSNGVFVLFGCTGVTTDAQGNIWAAAPTAARVIKFSPSGTRLASYGAGQLSQPMDVAFYNGLVYVVDQTRNRVAVFNTNGVFQGAFGSRGSGNLQFNKPTGLAIDNQGRMYVADSLNERIQVLRLN